MSANQLFQPSAKPQPGKLNHFFMVCRVPRTQWSVTEPKHRYPTRADAETAARNLARQTGESFVILETVAVVTPAPDPTAKGLL